MHSANPICTTTMWYFFGKLRAKLGAYTNEPPDGNITFYPKSSILSDGLDGKVFWRSPEGITGAVNSAILGSRPKLVPLPSHGHFFRAAYWAAARNWNEIQVP